MVGYPPLVRRSFHNYVLVLVALALGFSTSGVFSLCVHQDHTGLELTWATCCAEAECCTDGDEREHDSHGVEGDDGCSDYLLGSTQEWTAESSLSSNAPLALLSTPPAIDAFVAPSWPQPIPPSGPPPPRRDLKTVVIRC